MELLLRDKYIFNITKIEIIEGNKCIGYKKNNEGVIWKTIKYYHVTGTSNILPRETTLVMEEKEYNKKLIQ